MSHQAKQHATTPAAYFPPLENITKPNLTTEEAAFYCNRTEQTMRIWACRQPKGMPRPIRVNGRLAWPVAGIRALLEA